MFDRHQSNVNTFKQNYIIVNNNIILYKLHVSARKDHQQALHGIKNKKEGKIGFILDVVGGGRRHIKGDTVQLG